MYLNNLVVGIFVSIINNSIHIVILCKINLMNEYGKYILNSNTLQYLNNSTLQ